MDHHAKVEFFKIYIERTKCSSFLLTVVPEKTIVLIEHY